MKIRINFWNRLVIMTLIAMAIVEYVYWNSCMFDEFILYVVPIAWGTQVGGRIGNKIRDFVKKHFTYNK